MKKRISILLFALISCITIAKVNAATIAQDTFADEVISYNPGLSWYVYPDSIYTIPANVLGAPMGMYVNEPFTADDYSQIATLGDGGNITIKFNQPIEDNPRNPYGMDFIVFSNAQVYKVLDKYLRWQELAFVEISQDGSTWYLIKPSITPANLRINNGTGTDPLNYDVGKSYTAVSGYAEYTPTVGKPQDLAYPPFVNASRTDEELYTVPDRPANIRDLGYTNKVKFDYVSGGGDAFDIANAVLESAPGVPVIVNNQTVPAGISWFSYVRLTDARTGDSWPMLKDVSADIDAVSRTRPAQSIGEVKALPDSGYGLITEAIVTAVFPDEFFMESPNRSAAMRVSWDANTLDDDGRAIAVGDQITITGHLSKSQGRFSFEDPMFSFTNISVPLPKPLGIPIHNLAANIAYGLRVRTWGKITDPGNGYQFTITDGSDSATVLTPDYYEPKPIGTYVSVTGICDRDTGTGKVVVKVTDPSNNIKPY